MLTNSIRRALPRISPTYYYYPRTTTLLLGRAANPGNGAYLRLAAAAAAPSIILNSNNTNKRYASNLSTAAAATTIGSTENDKNNGKSSTTGPGWSGNAVLSVGLAAGLLGWGLAAVTMSDGVGAKGVTLLDSRKQWPRYASLKEMEIAIDEIRTELSSVEDIISTDPDDLHAHGYSEWSSCNPNDSLPVAVAYPRSTEQVSVLARICSKYHVPMIPYSGGTSLEGNFAAPFGGVSVDFAYMDRVVAVNREDMDVVVQPSVGWQDLNDHLAKMGCGLFFPVDPGPSAKIGGMIGTNCSGTNAVKYGTMKDSTLKLAVIPEALSVAIATFPTIRDAAAAAAEVMQGGIPVAAMEIMDEVQMRVVNLGGATAPRVWRETPTLFFKFAGSKAAVQDNITHVKGIAARNHGDGFEFAKDAREQKLLWSARKESLWSMLALRREGEEVWSTDVAVPFSRLADIIEVSKKEMDDLGLFASILGHIGDGNFHESIIYNPVNGEKEKVEACVKNMVRRALDMEGTCTGEHSIGWGKKDSLLLEVGEETLGVMRAVKAALDPAWIMNPGKIFDRLD
ncbi:D-lactate ferricytochrome c oxidoreductase [Gnomoniopsis sp. IMI 355080]|nr:D-lactate ferricytochrome c oxidoreductase [Gnomoniopsis sp. IMI 355080]